MILHDLFHHWYDYGLIITEQRLLRTVFAILEARLGRPVGPPEVTPHSAAADGLRDLLRLKLAWPHRPEDAPGPCHFPFDNGLYRRPQIVWPTRERPEPLYQILFQEMESCFATAQDVSRATEQLDHRLDTLVSAMR
jgi:hypothetical protein